MRPGLDEDLLEVDDKLICLLQAHPDGSDILRILDHRYDDEVPSWLGKRNFDLVILSGLQNSLGNIRRSLDLHDFLHSAKHSAYLRTFSETPCNFTCVPLLLQLNTTPSGLVMARCPTGPPSSPVASIQ